MKTSFSSFSRNEKKEILELYNEGYSPTEIAILMDIFPMEAVFCLKKMDVPLDMPKDVSQYQIDDERVIIISDTHLGSKYENLDYLREVYKMASEEGIHTILHGGDLIQSTMSNVQPKYENEMRQVEHVVIDYPYNKEIMNYILLGNHDYHTLRKHPIFLETLQTRKDFNILGFKRAYLTWLKELISLYHTTKKYPISIPSVETALNLRGHSHILSYNKTSSINIPTLSDDLFVLRNGRPGFLVGTHKPNEIVLESYYFKDSLHYEGKILTKKL